MSTIHETFILPARKQMQLDGMTISGLSFDVASTITGFSYEGPVFIAAVDYAGEISDEADIPPVVFLPAPEFMAAAGGRPFSVRRVVILYADCVAGEVMRDGRMCPVVDPVRITQDEFQSLISNRLHFGHLDGRFIEKIQTAVEPGEEGKK